MYKLSTDIEFLVKIEKRTNSYETFGEFSFSFSILLNSTFTIKPKKEKFCIYTKRTNVQS